jgi:hypothetical protein
MPNLAKTRPSKKLLDAYKVAGFRTRTRIEGYASEPTGFVITLDRRSKKPSALAAGSDVTVFTTSVGGGLAIWDVGIGKFI